MEIYIFSYDLAIAVYGILKLGAQKILKELLIANEVLIANVYFQIKTIITTDIKALPAVQIFASKRLITFWECN